MSIQQDQKGKPRLIFHITHPHHRSTLNISPKILLWLSCNFSLSFCLRLFTKSGFFSTLKTMIVLVSIYQTIISNTGLPWWLSDKESACQCRRCEFDPWSRKIPWRMKLQLIPVFFPGKFHGPRNLAGYTARGPKELDMTYQLNNSNNK